MRSLLVALLAIPMTVPWIADASLYADPSIEITADTAATHLEISKWEGAFRPNTVAEAPMLKDITDGGKNFPGYNDNTFSFVVTDPPADIDHEKADVPPDKATIVVLRRPPLEIAGPEIEVDRIANLSLIETGVHTGKFIPGRAVFIVVSNKVDDEQSPGVPDKSADDRTIRGRIGDTVEVRYKNATKALPICKEPPKPERDYVKTRFHVLKVTEPYVDSGFGDPLRGACNGSFDFEDTNGNGAHDVGELSETFKDVNTDSKRNVGSALASVVDVIDDVDLMNAAWGQACVEFRTTHLAEFARLFSLDLRPSQMDIFIEEPPGGEPWRDTGIPGGGGGAGNSTFDFTDTNGNGTHDTGEPSEEFTDCGGSDANQTYDFAVNLADGSLDGSSDPKFPTKEERSLLEVLGDGKPSTLDIYVINAFSGTAVGEAFNFESTKAFSFAGTAFPEAPRRRNSIIVLASHFGKKFDGTGKDFANTAHEAGHVLMNVEDEVMNDRTNLMSVPYAGYETDGIDKTKRLTSDQVTDAKTDKDTAVLRNRK